MSLSKKKQVGVFSTQLMKLRNECEFINIEEAITLIKSGAKVTESVVAFTFDDGYEDCFIDIAPALNKFNVNAAFFINPNFMTGSIEYKKDFFKSKVPDVPVRNAMTRDMVIELAKEGFVIGAHTLDHVRLVGLSSCEIRRQVVGCKSAIEDLIKQPCEYFAWTYGKFSDIDEESLFVASRNFQYVFSSDNYREYMTKEGVINRRHFECDWPNSHMRYFLSKKRTRLISQ